MATIRSYICAWDMWPYLARSHSTIEVGLLELHGPPDGGAGPGPGPGAGAAAPDRKLCVFDQALVVSRSVARTRQ